MQMPKSNSAVPSALALPTEKGDNMRWTVEGVALFSATERWSVQAKLNYYINDNGNSNDDVQLETVKF